MSPALLIALTLAGLCLAFAACRVFARRLNNYGIVDIAWSYGFALAVGLWAAIGPGWLVRRAWIAALVLIWSLRLGTHLLVRVSRLHPREDSRYEDLRRDWVARFEAKMTGFFQLQAASIVLLCAPFFAVCLNPAPRVAAAEIAGTILWLAGVGGEALADAQLAGFRRDPARHGQVCQAGLWRFSRHPNYFFEWIIWVGYFVFACGSPGGWIGLISPAAMLYLLLRVTGVPMAEKQSLRSKGEAYRRYQETTNAFFPWFPRRASAP